MDLNHFLRERRSRWQRLSVLLDRTDRNGVESLSPPEAEEFFSLYRLVSSDLNLVQTRTGNPGLTEYLEGLVGRAYAQMVVPREAKFFRSWWMILRHYFPAALRSEPAALALSVTALVGGLLLGLVATYAKPAVAPVFLPAEQLQETPRERVVRLEQAEREGHRAIASASDNGTFAVFLFNNNIRVAVLALALSVTFGIGTLVILFYNGAMLGSLAALYFLDGEGKFFIAWVGPHGSIELPCVMFAGAAGLMIATRQLRRSDGPFLVQVRAIRPKLVDIIIGTSTLLVLAGCIEGGFSQINEPTIPYWFKILVAAILFAALLAYIFLMPANPRPAADSGATGSKQLPGLD
ncbi:MAG TPA: stage II sporulation protein M [Tepidisphaeraceae bacterium]|jgi:uncharacterized membrane protein SpoIIM required for sporulation|nr:stage II sporulation protein M [Tepidisphaeraceae bacterium]